MNSLSTGWKRRQTSVKYKESMVETKYVGMGFAVLLGGDCVEITSDKMWNMGEFQNFS